MKRRCENSTAWGGRCRAEQPSSRFSALQRNDDFHTQVRVGFLLSYLFTRGMPLAPRPSPERKGGAGDRHALLHSNPGQVMKTILIVDDAPDNILALSTTLREKYTIRAAPNGPRALLLARKSPPPDLILLDVLMPEMDGYAVCRQLKEDPATRAIPVIFVTALADEADELRGFNLGAVDYISKPIRPALVRARVSTHLQLRTMQQAVEDRNRALEESARLRDDVENMTRHDLKAPLSGIISLPRIISNKYDIDPFGKNLLEMIERAGKKMLTMINRSLDLYKMEAGTYQACIQTIDISPILFNTLSEVASGVDYANEWRVTLNGDSLPAGQPIWARSEEMLCYPMFYNLIQNAFEASPEGGSIAVDIDDRDKSRLNIAITNAGAVPEEVRERFFDKYITHGKGHGIGLGTYSAYLCAKTMNGDITLDALNDKTRIVVTLRRQA